MAVFRKLLGSLPRPVRILDVGGSEAFWRPAGVDTEQGVEIVVLNLACPRTSTPGISSVAGDARHLPFRDAAFDVVFSNSVIEHLGSLEAQRRMADEIRRVGRRHFLQTPNRWFPIEPHFLLPFFQWLPVASRVWLVRHFDLGWNGRIPDLHRARAFVESIRLLDDAELRDLFPGSRLVAERFLGMVKSYMVCGGW
jgi:hypothetical protein